MKLRLGVSLWIISWIPIAQILGANADQRLVIWGIQVVIGIAGIALAGTSFAHAVKLKGWRGAPGVAWQAMLHGTSTREVAEAEAVVEPTPESA